jgi:hypothetical protein
MPADTPDYRYLTLAATSHSSILLPGESPQLYDEFRAHYFNLHQPVNIVEAEQVEDMVRSRWIINRLSSMESALITLENGGVQVAYPDVAQIPKRAQAATAYVALSTVGPSTALKRDIARQLRIYKSAVKEFERLCKLRPQSPLALDTPEHGPRK